MTFQEFKKLPAGEVFATGVTIDNYTGINMSNSDKQLRWVAKKGDGWDDWAIYIHFADRDADWIRRQGDKVTSKPNIQKLVSPDEEMMARYRF